MGRDEMREMALMPPGFQEDRRFSRACRCRPWGSQERVGCKMEGTHHSRHKIQLTAPSGCLHSTNHQHHLKALKRRYSHVLLFWRAQCPCPCTAAPSTWACPVLLMLTWTLEECTGTSTVLVV